MCWVFVRCEAYFAVRRVFVLRIVQFKGCFVRSVVVCYSCFWGVRTLVMVFVCWDLCLFVDRVFAQHLGYLHSEYWYSAYGCVCSRQALDG